MRSGFAVLVAICGLISVAVALGGYQDFGLVAPTLVFGGMAAMALIVVLMNVLGIKSVRAVSEDGKPLVGQIGGALIVIAGLAFLCLAAGVYSEGLPVAAAMLGLWAGLLIYAGVERILNARKAQKGFDIPADKKEPGPTSR